MSMPEAPPTGHPNTTTKALRWSVVRPWNRDVTIIYVYDRDTHTVAYREVSGLFQFDTLGKLSTEKQLGWFNLVIEDLTYRIAEYQ